jgi:hypothetical protein
VRTCFILFVVALLLVSCKPSSSDGKNPEPNGKTKTSKIDIIKPAIEKLDVPIKAVVITEVQRYSPPDGKVWPDSSAMIGRTSWHEDNGATILVSASSASAPKEPSSIFQWDIVSGKLDIIPMNPPPPVDAEGPIAILGDGQLFLFISNAGVSKTQGFKIDEGGSMPASIVDSLWIYNLKGELVSRTGVDTSNYELLADTMLAPLEGYLTSSLLFREARTVEVKLPGDVTRLAQTWIEFDLRHGGFFKLDDLLKEASGGKLSGYSDRDNLYCFTNESGDKGPVTYISRNGSMLELEGWKQTDIPDSQPKPINITGKIPSVHYNGSTVVFAIQDKTETGSNYAVALKLTGETGSKSNAGVIWSGEVPNIFAESTVITDSDGRPFIACLDVNNGNVSIFDPLLGNVRAQKSIQPGNSGSGLHFCYPEIQGNGQNRLLIHDPMSNSIIEVQVEIRNPGEGVGIVPINEGNKSTG